MLKKLRNAFLLALAAGLGVVTANLLASDIESSNFSETAASNNATPPNGAPEGMAPSAVNDTIREIMGALKRDWDRSHVTIASTGSANAYVLTYATAPSAYVNGQQFSFNANFANTGSATANANGLGAKTIQKQTSSGMANLAAGDVQPGQHVLLEYDSGLDKLILLNPQASTATTFTGGTLTSATNMSGARFDEASAGNIASAATTNIGAGAGNYCVITGSTTITAFDTVQAGARRVCKFAGSLTLTHNATSLILPNNGSNITTAAGDTMEAVSLGSGNWIVTDYQKANGQALQGSAAIGGTTYSNSQLLTAGTTFNVPAGVSQVLAVLQGGGGAGGGTSAASGASASSGSPGALATAIVAVTPSGTVTYSIGAAGTAGSAGNNPGNPGGDTTFGTVAAKGGPGGLGTSTAASPTAAPLGAVASPLAPSGTTSVISIWTGVGIAGTPSAAGPVGGSSAFGTGGNGGVIGGGNGQAPSAGNYGAGGGGGHSGGGTSAGGAGLAGAIQVFW